MDSRLRGNDSFLCSGQSNYCPSLLKLALIGVEGYPPREQPAPVAGTTVGHAILSGPAKGHCEYIRALLGRTCKKGSADVSLTSNQLVA
jgi:hypothetical protein